MDMNKSDIPTTVAIGTQNKAKTEGVKLAFSKIHSRLELHGFSVDSGISEQPTTDEESVTGAINRAEAALAMLKTADYGVGLEGNVATVSDRMFLHGWVAIIDRSGTIGLGHSNGVELPEHMKMAIDAGAELGPLVQNLLKDDRNEVRHSLGTAGILTGGLMTRIGEFEDATTMALAKFIKPDLYK